MAQTETLCVEIDAETKELADETFGRLGLTTADAVNVFLRKSIDAGGFPFAVCRGLNSETLEAIKDARDGKNLIGPFRTVEALMESLNADD